MDDYTISIFDSSVHMVSPYSHVMSVWCLNGNTRYDKKDVRHLYFLAHESLNIYNSRIIQIPLLFFNQNTWHECGCHTHRVEVCATIRDMGDSEIVYDDKAKEVIDGFIDRLICKYMNAKIFPDCAKMVFEINCENSNVDILSETHITDLRIVR